MPEKMVYNNQRIMPHLKSTFPGWIQRTNSKHQMLKHEDVIQAAVPHLS